MIPICKSVEPDHEIPQRQRLNPSDQYALTGKE